MGKPTTNSCAGPPWGAGRSRREVGGKDRWGKGGSGEPGGGEARAARPPASRSTSPSHCRPGRRKPHSLAPRPPQVHRPTIPRAPTPTVAQLVPRLRPSSTVTRTADRPRRRREKWPREAGSEEAGPRRQAPIPKTGSEGRGRSDFRQTEVAPLTSPRLRQRRAGFRFRWRLSVARS